MKRGSRISGIDFFGLGKFVLFLAPFLVLGSLLPDFVFLKGAEFSDLLIAHLPNLAFLGDAIRETGQVPLWSPAILGGFPFFADPLSGLWYPPGWPAAFRPGPWAFTLLASGHLAFGMLGMQRWLRFKGLSPLGQAAGALGFGLMPKLLAHDAAGHLTLVYAIAWTPWLLLAEHRRGRFFRPGVVLGIIFLADPRWAAYAAVLWIAYHAAHSQNAGRDEAEKTPGGQWPSLLRGILPEALIALMFSGPLLLPLIQYSSLSSRALITPAETLAFSLEPARLAGLVLPLVGGQVEWVMYAGGAVLVYSLSGIVQPGVRKQAVFWGGAAVISLLFALGDQVPVLRLWASVPGANLLRVPARALFIFEFSLLVLMACGLDGLSGSDGTAPRARRSLLRMATAFAGAALAFIAAGFWVTGEIRAGMIWSGVSVLIAATGLAGRVSGRLPRTWFAAICLAVLLADGAFFSAISFEAKPAAAVNAEGADAAAWLANQPGLFRVYSPSYSIPQHVAAAYGLELADGVDPLQLEAYAAFIAQASGVPRDGYSVTVPAMAGLPASANQGYRPDARLLGRLNVRYVVSTFDLETDGLVLARRFGETRIYKNVYDLGRVWYEGEDGGRPEILGRTPNRVEIRCGCGAGKIVLSEQDFPGWRVSGGVLVDPSAGNLRTITVDGTNDLVVLEFRPVSLYAGLGLFALCLLWLALRREAEAR